jgi:CxxC motif-containing protein
MQGCICKSINIIEHINRIKNKNHRVISIDAEKASDKVQYLFIRKSLKKLEIKDGVSIIVKAIYSKPIAKTY